MDSVEDTAKRIAERGRDALVERLRPAFRDAAEAHKDVLQLDDEQLEQMVQRAADRADGLQWRRALAGVATEELGIGLGEALSHPAVARAQAIVGAPSYEESLAALETGPRTLRAVETIESEQEEQEEAEDDALEESELQEALGKAEAARAAEADEEPELEADLALPGSEDESDEEETELAEDEEATGLADDEEATEYDEYADDAGASLQLISTHMGGIANLGPSEEGIELRLSEAGLDIARGGGAVLGRLRWPEIRALDVPSPRGLRRRRKAGTAHLVIRTDHGDASFEVPSLSSEELEQRLAPVVERYAVKT